MKKANVRIIAVLFLAFFLLVTPASARISMSIISTEVQVHYENNWDAAILASTGGSYAAAYDVVKYAAAHNVKATRSLTSIATEIRCHALFYLGGDRGSSQPANIGVTEGNWDFLP